MRKTVLAHVIFLVACSGSASTPSQPDADTLAALTCNELGARARTLVAGLDTTCSTVDDCTLAGFVDPRCEGDRQLIQGGGAPLSTTGAANADLKALEAEFASRCYSAACSATNTCTADSGPMALSCSTDKKCVGRTQSCNMPHADAGVPDAGLAGLTCNDLHDRATALIQTLDTTCAHASDCVLVGGTGDCDCAPTLTSGSGVTLSTTGAASPELHAIEAEYASRCQAAACSSTNSCICDAAPAQITCESQHCVAAERSCLTPPPDAPVPADAGLSSLTCNDLHDRAASIAATLDKACGTVDDCVLIGFVAGSCSGEPQLFPSGGAALSKTGATSADLKAVSDEFDGRCRHAACSSTNSCSPDSAPAALACTSKLCTASLRSCLDLPDAQP